MAEPGKGNGFLGFLRVIWRGINFTRVAILNLIFFGLLLVIILAAMRKPQPLQDKTVLVIQPVGRIVEQYNQTMNAHVLRNHDGAHLTFPGLADGIALWSWQRDFVDRAVSTPAVFCAHEVGLGKTLTAITLAMTLRQFGLANRPALIVPLHLIEQATPKK